MILQIEGLLEKSLEAAKLLEAFPKLLERKAPEPVPRANSASLPDWES